MEETSTPEAASAAASAPLPRRFGLGRLVLIALGLGLSVWFGLRVQSALQSRRSLAEERLQVAAAASAAPAAAPVELLRGKTERWRPAVALDGTLRALNEADLAFKAAGRLASIKVQVGARVTRGQTLARLEQTEAAAQLQAAQAQLRASEAQLAMSGDSARRTGALVGSGAASAAVGVQVEQQHKLASAQLDGARAQVALAASNLANHTLRAPFAGTVTRVPSGPGMMVSPGVSMFHLEDTSQLKLLGTVTEADAALVELGAEVEILAEGQRVRGKVSAVLRSVDPSTRRVPVEALISDEAAEGLRAGSLVRATIRGSQELPVLRLPASALRPGSQDEVMVVRDGRMTRRRIAFTGDGAGAILVRSGLDIDDTVLDNPAAESRDGQPLALPGSGARP